jgi:hypothetical protein
MRQAISTAQSPEQRASVRERLIPIATVLVERAKATGRLRPEFQQGDLPMLFWTTGAISEYTVDVAPNLWRRYLDVLLDGFAADTEPRQPITVEPPDLDQLDAIMQTWPSKH